MTLKTPKTHRVRGFLKPAAGAAVVGAGVVATSTFSRKTLVVTGAAAVVVAVVILQKAPYPVGFGFF